MHVPLSKHQSGLGLGVVVAGRRAADEHGGATVPTEGVLQDAGHFAVAVRHVRFLQEREGETGGKIRREETERKKTQNQR